MKVGLEIHVQVATKSKLFCSCSSDFLSSPPNTNVCPICTGQPGSKPMGVNKEAVRCALIVSAAFGCKINRAFRILRKHYFYPDLPNNYQRTSEPVGEKGELFGVRVREVHIEEDPGRYELRKGLVDYNRSGVPLLEIVTEPDMDSVESVERFLKELSLLLQYLGVQKYRESGMRVDVNISLEGGNRVEIKNVNSIDNVKKAILYEVSRQRKLLDSNKAVEMETRHWDETRGVTVTLREKETAEDYRYMPDPDLPPVILDADFVDSVLASIPELPWEKMKRFAEKYGISTETARIFVLDKELADFFENLAGETDPQFSLSFSLMLRGELNYRGISFSSVRDPDRLLTLGRMYYRGDVTKPLAIKAMRRILDDPSFVPGKVGKVTGKDLQHIALEVLQENERAVRDFLSGNRKALNSIVGAVLRRCKGSADPREVKDVVLRLLNEKNEKNGAAGI